MTVIAWDGKTLAADKQVTCGNTGAKGKKLFHHGNTALAWYGSQESGCILINWYLSGANEDDWPNKQRDNENFTRLIVVNEHGCFEYENEPIPIKILSKFAAWGTGGSIALGALAMGADACTAVKIASKYDIYCGFGVDSYKVKK